VCVCVCVCVSDAVCMDLCLQEPRLTNRLLKFSSFTFFWKRTFDGVITG